MNKKKHPKDRSAFLVLVVSFYKTPFVWGFFSFVTLLLGRLFLTYDMWEMVFMYGFSSLCFLMVLMLVIKSAILAVRDIRTDGTDVPTTLVQQYFQTVIYSRGGDQERNLAINNQLIQLEEVARDPNEIPKIKKLKSAKNPLDTLWVIGEEVVIEKSLRERLKKQKQRKGNKVQFYQAIIDQIDLHHEQNQVIDNIKDAEYINNLNKED